MSELKKLAESGRGSDLGHLAVERLVREGINPDLGLHALGPGQLVDLRLVNLGVDLHASDIRQTEDLLPLADRRAFLDLGRVAAKRPAGSLA